MNRNFAPGFKTLEQFNRYAEPVLSEAEAFKPAQESSRAGLTLD